MIADDHDDVTDLFVRIIQEGLRTIAEARADCDPTAW